MFGEHSVNVLLGHEYYNTKTRYLEAVAQGLFSPEIQEINAAAKKADASGNSQDDSNAGDGSTEQQVRRCRQLRDGSICGDRRGSQAEHAHEGGQSLDDSRVLLNEFRNGLQDARKAVRNAGNHWSQRIANGDLHIVGRVGKHLQPAFRGGIPFLCFSGEGGIFPEGIIRVPDRVSHQIAGSRPRQDHALHPGFGDPQIVQNDGCGGAVALQAFSALVISRSILASVLISGSKISW